MAGPGDIGAPPPFPYAFDAPDLASLQFPWSDPPAAASIDPLAATPPPAPELGALQPGIGIPAAALDAAVPPPPQLGPPEAGAAPPAPPPEVAPPAPPPLPYGAEMPPVPAALPPGVAGPAPATVRDQPGLTVRPDPGPEGLLQEQENDRALGDPVGFAGEGAAADRARALYITRRKAEMAAADIEASQQHLASWRAADAATQIKMDAVIADSQRLADTKIDPSGGLSGGQKVAGVLGAIIGGLVQGRTGSARNAGMDALDNVINRGIEAQKADLARQGEHVNLRRNVLAAEFARHGDMFQAEETVRRAAWQHADDLLAAEEQNYGERGTTRRFIAEKRAAMAGRMAMSDQAFRQKNLENELNIQKARREQQIADETAHNNRAELGYKYADLSSRAADRQEARDARAADKATEAADKQAERRRQFAIGGIPQMQVGSDGKPAIGPDGKPVIVYDDLRNADKSVWQAESPEATRELRQKKSAASEVISIIDEIRAIRDRVGGESKLLNSDDSQRLEVLQARAKLLTKAGTQGMSSDKDMETLEGASGTSDAASWRSQEARLLEARARTEGALNTAFRDAKYYGPAITYPLSRPTTSTPAEDEFQKLLEKPKVTLVDEVNDEIKRRTLALSPDEQRAAGGTITRPSIAGAQDRGLELTPFQRGVYEEVLTRYSPDISRDQRQSIGALGAAAVGTGPAAIEASAKLQRIATEAHTTQLRAAAAAALEESQQASLGGAPAVPPPAHDVSYEHLPPVPPHGRR